MFGIFGSEPGEDPESFEPDLEQRQPLADLRAQVDRRGWGWSVRVPLRADVVEVEKQLVPYEQVVVQRRKTERVEQVETTVRRERLVVDEHGQTVVRAAGDPN